MKRKRLMDLSERQLRHRVSQDMLQHSFLHVTLPNTAEVDNTTHNLLNVVISNSNQSTSSTSQSVHNEIEIVNESTTSEPVFCENSSNVNQDDLNVQDDLRIDLDNIYYENENYEMDKDSENLKTFLATWAADYNITHSQLKPLLHKLNEHTCFQEEIPKDPRTLLKTPRNKTVIKTVRPGIYYHFGIKSAIEEILTKYENYPLSNIKIKIGIDGVPLAKSSTAQFWPILASIGPFPDIFIIGVYFGHEKPTYEEEFLEDFLSEVEDLCIDGFNFKEKILDCEIDCIICDAPAKSFILNVKGHTGYHSCTKCIIRGKWSKHRVCFPHTGRFHKKRTDADIRNQLHKKHQSGHCCLRRIPNFDLVNDIPLDYMHLVCLGCMKRLMYFWVIVRSKCRLRKWQISKLSLRLLRIAKYIPTEFARKPRSIKVIKFWKATEFRQFLLYTGSVLLKEILPYKLYVHFNSLHVAIRILCSKNLAKKKRYSNYADDLLSHFVRSLTILYGSFSVSHNMHGLLHLADVAKRRGSLDNCSAFEFENFMQYLKKWMRKGDKPLQQLVRRYSEFKKNCTKLTKAPKEGIIINDCSQHCDGPLLDGCCTPQYKKLTIEGLTLDVSKLGDTCFGLNNKDIILISNIAHSADSKEIVVIGQKFKTVGDFYTKPCKSSVVNEFIVKDLSNLQMWPLKEVKRKYLIIPTKKNEYIVSSLLHID
ncbi:uncharacterized protein LOC127283847 [Leptopilina boulardi]|uniref:uncharacterized protein LOC127279859 n=1 Tax=Leptopilina boulardi TaxID=63433 RepID=UPI0021F51F17|nr:uncharacterized protein LOC127279859 [Leptopilina boulardi]XP_051158454.1 uncharacterized protein LOC127279859 [Leptopilina boulardi]XP_051158455.1 uncharacterized protein LOC127279860 [Leptopilina boulardi]XP_051158456.1 uncharacterized protein LOC127279860 [Leptopilina boulardi]XP_051164904.1 uncharacterized protein LOC127283847 [Leptopilina boulardi]XP_051164905.1 uncharacterized protein LOC127283847 [Leptopilina boulardi]